MDLSFYLYKLSVMVRAAETKPVLLVTHDREDLAALDARIIRLRRGDEQ